MDLKTLRETFFPEKLTCSLCRREIFGDSPFCKDCLDALPRNDGAICDHCGRKTSARVSYCDSCREKNLSFDVARSPFLYEPPVSYALQKLKYDNAKYFARDFAPELVRTYLAEFWTCDAVVFTPMTGKREKKRGYNQAKLLAEAFSERTGIPLLTDVLYKKRETESQVGMTQKERFINLSGSFGVRHSREVAGKNVLLVDDVLTTGATAECCAAALRRAGAERVCVLTVASVPDRSARTLRESGDPAEDPRGEATVS